MTKQGIMVVSPHCFSPLTEQHQIWLTFLPLCVSSCGREAQTNALGGVLASPQVFSHDGYHTHSPLFGVEKYFLYTKLSSLLCPSCFANVVYACEVHVVFGLDAAILLYFSHFYCDLFSCLSLFFPGTGFSNSKNRILASTC